MVQKGMKGLSIVRVVRLNKGTKFEKSVRGEFHISVNKAIPASHKDFQPQFLVQREEKQQNFKPKASKPHKDVSRFNKKLDKFKQAV